MHTPTSQPRSGHGSRWTGGSRWATGTRWASAADPAMRISDSERADVADRLSRHYEDGRLDQAEFNERLDRAMNAKTRGDLHGLFDDLPGDEPGDVPAGNAGGQPAAVPHRPPSRVRGSRLGFLVLIAIATVFIAQALAHSFIPWLLIGVVAFLWIRDR